MAAWKLAEKQAEKERRREEAKAQLKENHERFIRDSVSELGLNLDELDDCQLHDSIRSRVHFIEAEIAEHEWSRSLTDVMRDENELEGDDLQRIIINQNRILIQQNELIARLLEKMQ